MDKTEQTQLTKHNAAILRLEKIVSAIARRLAIVEAENKKLRHSVARAHASVHEYSTKIPKN